MVRHVSGSANGRCKHVRAGDAQIELVHTCVVRVLYWSRMKQRGCVGSIERTLRFFLP